MRLCGPLEKKETNLLSRAKNQTRIGRRFSPYQVGTLTTLRYTASDGEELQEQPAEATSTTGTSSMHTVI
jgi:hypothetical protein